MTRTTRDSHGTAASDRYPWETTGGPEVGRDVPITNPPREELAPGVLAPPEGNGKPAEENKSGASAEATEVREVRAEDPTLSPEANQRLTEELREVVGTDRVRVPADRPHATRGEHPQQHGIGAYFNMHRFQLLRATAIVLTFGGILALTTGDWWMLPLAAGLHALGTMFVVITVVRLTTTSEHPSPDVAAAMAEEGVPNPDEHFSRMVEEFRQEPERGASEVFSPGANERSVEASAAPAEAAAEQSSAMTPTAQPSEAEGQGAMPDLLVWSVAAALLVFSIALPAARGGGWLWLLTAVMVPLLAGWVLMQRLLRRRGFHLGPRSLAAIIVCTALSVAAFCAVVALAFQH